MLPLPATWTYEEGLPPEIGILGFWDSTVVAEDSRGYSIFLHSPVQTRGASLSFRELHGHLPFHRQAREARVWVEAKDEAHMQEHQGSRGVSTPSHRRLSQQISQLYMVCFCYLAYGQEYYLILVLRIHLLLHQL